jgi:hypothetical protein
MAATALEARVSALTQQLTKEQAAVGTAVEQRLADAKQQKEVQRKALAKQARGHSQKVDVLEQQHEDTVNDLIQSSKSFATEARYLA